MNEDQQDNIGSDTSLWLRPLRLLFDHGTPPCDCTILAFKDTPQGDLPFGVVTKTKDNRVICWPDLPTKPQPASEFGIPVFIDHVTLEFPSQKMHVTWFDDDGKREHHSQAWRLHPFDGSGVALWFKLMVRCSVLEDQDLRVERNIKSPTSDVERRKAEFARYANSIKFQRIKLPPGKPEGDYVFVVIYVVIDPGAEIVLTSDMFLAGGNVDDVVDGWPDGSVFGIQPIKFKVSDFEMVVATACPPGNLDPDVFLGFPRAMASQ